MIDVAGIIAVFNSAAAGLKDTVDAFKALRGRQPKTEEITMAFERVLSAQEAVFEVKQVIFSLQEENAELKIRLKDCEQFQADKDKLELRAVTPAAFAYVDKTVEPPYIGFPWYCQHCLDNRKKSVFQFAKRDFGFDVYQCYSCSTQIQVPNGIKAEILTTGIRRPDLTGY